MKAIPLAGITALVICLYCLMVPMLSLHAQATQEINKWQFVGPADPIICGVAPHPVSQNIVYLCTYNFVYRSNDFGQNWVMLARPDHKTSLYKFTGVCVDPNNPDIVYASTNSLGVWKSSDGGQHWIHLTSGLARPDGSFRSLYFISISPHDSNLVFTGGISGLLVSTDAGLTWACIDGEIALSIQFHPTDSEVIYYLNEFRAMKSNDGGITWHIIPGMQPYLDFIVVSPSDPLTIYAGRRSACCIWKSTDGGETSQLLFSGAHEQLDAIAVDATNSDRVFSGTTKWGFAISSDGGRSWVTIDDDYPSRYPSIILQHPGDPVRWYAAFGKSQYAPTAKGVAGAFGLQRSEDYGRTWVGSNRGVMSEWSSCDTFWPTQGSPPTYFLAEGETLSSSSDNATNWSVLFEEPDSREFYSIITPENRTDLIFAATHYKIYRSTDSGSQWDLVYGPGYTDLRALKMPPGQDCTVYVYTFGGAGCLKTTDCGNTWTFIYQLPEDIAFDHGDPNILYTYTFRTLSRSSDDGQSWISLGVSASRGFAQSQSSPNILYAFASSSPNVRRSTDWGLSWQATTAEEGYNFKQVQVDPFNPDVLYGIQVFVPGFFRSVDQGIHWKNIGHGLDEWGLCHYGFKHFWIYRPNSTDPMRVFIQDKSGFGLFEIILTLPGDLDMDSLFTEADASLMGDYLSDNSILTAESPDPDTNGDGRTNVVDFLSLKLKSDIPARR